MNKGKGAAPTIIPWNKASVQTTMRHTAERAKLYVNYRLSPRGGTRATAQVIN